MLISVIWDRLGPCCWAASATLAWFIFLFPWQNSLYMSVSASLGDHLQPVAPIWVESPLWRWSGGTGVLDRICFSVIFLCNSRRDQVFFGRTRTWSLHLHDCSRRINGILASYHSLKNNIGNGLNLWRRHRRCQGQLSPRRSIRVIRFLLLSSGYVRNWVQAFQFHFW